MQDTGLKPLRVLVTRPARDAQHWVAQLQRCGVAAEAFPLIEIAPASGAASVQARADTWKAMVRGDYAACLFVSGNAVDHFFKSNQALAQTGSCESAIENIANGMPGAVSSGVRFMAPGPGTVAALAAAGIPAGQIDAPAANALQFDSEALWDVVGQRDWQGSRVLVVRGQDSGAHGEAPSSGRDWI
ncbi:MAG: uroporphyrinogen-III synthase, partial [Polaromonas sp.]|nr:uroporphyrinogen-III synthase [Polaromonas sp.]